MSIDPNLIEFAGSERQAEVLRAVIEHGSQRKAAAALGLAKNAVDQHVAAAKARAVRRGYAPEAAMTRAVPDGMKAKGVSTYFNADGVPAGQWVKAELDSDRSGDLMRAAAEALASEVRGLAPLTTRPALVLDDLLCVYPLGDPHFGLYTWAKECGESFDLQEAERVTLGAVDRLVSVAPAAATAVLLLLGDVFHANDQSNVTPAHRHQLDVDSRFAKVLGVGIKAFRHAVLRLLEKHARVVVRCVAGNHDPTAIWGLAYALQAFFAAEPRVTVDLSPAAHWFFRFGRVLIGATHGDKSKPEVLPGVMACDRAHDWGKTLYRYWYTGHIHSSNVKEFPGVVWESFRTLAAQDAYAAGHGYRAGRDMRCLVLHAEFGEIERYRCDVGMIEKGST